MKRSDERKRFVQTAGSVRQKRFVVHQREKRKIDHQIAFVRYRQISDEPIRLLGDVRGNRNTICSVNGYGDGANAIESGGSTLLIARKRTPRWPPIGRTVFKKHPSKRA